MSYQLFYWPLPFRGSFIRLALVLAEQPYTDASTDQVMNWKNQPVDQQSLPTMAPPFLAEDSSPGYGQLPVILQHLCETYGLTPNDAYQRKLCLKMMLDASDVLLEITRHHGMTMWTTDDWSAFREHRLPRWMQIFEQTYQRFGDLKAPYFFGPTLTEADIIVYGLWGTMISRLPELNPDFTKNAPKLANLVASLARHPRIADFESRQKAEFGDLYCGGQIEASLREMLKGNG